MRAFWAEEMLVTGGMAHTQALRVPSCLEQGVRGCQRLRLGWEFTSGVCMCRREKGNPNELQRNVG